MRRRARLDRSDVYAPAPGAAPSAQPAAVTRILRLQRLAGNAAVTGILQRSTGDGQSDTTPAGHANEWFSPTFIDEFTVTLHEMTRLAEAVGRQDAEAAVREVHVVRGVAEDAAEHARATHERRAGEAVADAIGAFVHAAISVVPAAVSIGGAPRRASGGSAHGPLAAASSALSDARHAAADAEVAASGLVLRQQVHAIGEMLRRVSAASEGAPDAAALIEGLAAAIDAAPPIPRA